jgi:hypothetical protein
VTVGMLQVRVFDYDNVSGPRTSSGSTSRRLLIKRRPNPREFPDGGLDLMRREGFVGP